jgi:hypothetical protein
MKAAYAFATCFSQLISLVSFAVHFKVGVVIFGSIILACTITGIIWLFAKNLPENKKEIGKALLLGTAVTIVLISSFLFWLVHSFTR